MPEKLKKINKSGSMKNNKSDFMKNNKSYYDPPYNQKYYGNGLWSSDKKTGVKKKDLYYNSKYQASYYGNGLYGPEPDEAERHFRNTNTPLWAIILILLCASPR